MEGIKNTIKGSMVHLVTEKLKALGFEVQGGAPNAILYFKKEGYCILRLGDEPYKPEEFPESQPVIEILLESLGTEAEIDLTIQDAVQKAKLNF